MVLRRRRRRRAPPPSSSPSSSSSSVLWSVPLGPGAVGWNVVVDSAVADSGADGGNASLGCRAFVSAVGAGLVVVDVCPAAGELPQIVARLQLEV